MDINTALQHALACLRQAHLATSQEAPHQETNHQEICQAPAPRARLEAEILLGFVLGKERVWLHTHDRQKLDSREQERFFSLIDQRAKGCPIEYLTHKVSFMDFEVFVDPSVLIPRPESEILVQKVCETLSHDQSPHLTLIEVGIGSGALSIAIARAFPKLSIIATDISQAALHTAARNIAHFDLQERIMLRHTSLLDGIDTSSISLVFSNPPYIATSYPIAKSLSYEPSSALFGGEKGSEILESLIAKCSTHKIPYLVCEMGYDQKHHLAQVLESSGYEAEFYTDLAGLDRGFVARLQS